MFKRQYNKVRVKDFIGDISDHGLISCSIAVRATVQGSKEEGCTLPKKLRWQEKAAPLIRRALVQDPQLDQSAQRQVTDINEEVKNINELITRNASRFLVRTGHNKKAKKSGLINTTIGYVRK